MSMLPSVEFEALPFREKVRLVARVALHGDDEGRKAEAAAWLEQALHDLEANPLLGFEPHGQQGDFISARTPVVAAFAGNRFGKSTVGGVCALRESLSADLLPDSLRASKRFDAPTQGWIMLPTEDKIEDSFRPVFQKWCPPSEFLGGSWGKAYNGASHTLRFKNGSTIGFKTYKQDPSTLGGAALHWVLYDEPPPKKHREEGMMRLADYGGFEMFAMTPLESNTGYVRREIWKKRESPDITVVKGSIYDNPTLNRATVDRVLGSLSDVWRRAREFGDFVDVGGLIYPDFERCVAKEPWPADVIRRMDVSVSIDPGIRNCGISFNAFDDENVQRVFAALLLQDATPKEYATAIRRELARWGLRTDSQNVSFVVDPAARQRGQTNATTVLSALNVEGIYAYPGQNDVQAGIGQLRTRMTHDRFLVSPERTAGLLKLRDEADEYAAKEPDEGKDDSHLEPVKTNDHILDTVRYSAMEHFFDPVAEAQAPKQTLGYEPAEGRVRPNVLSQGGPQPALPMGFMT